jgi:hypothetical protein
MTWQRLTLMSIVLAVVFAGCTDDPHAPKNFGLGTLGTEDREPIPAKASTATHIPTEEELDEFRDLQTYTAHYRDVLRLMGHPMEITEGPDSTEVWSYPWGDECLITLDSRRYVQSVDYTPATAE